ncbi:hypothetical protein [Pelagibius sp. Alg239-R121]|uniref:hypothetical protein n=1 Tax=Pelagibius sp. Alg239-R121 TaxID=2993448 RepID=UPI0024A644C4|nr:hypothetical protein [Pelagibius sp. Alg239-R121]
MSILPIGHLAFTKADINVLVEAGNTLVDDRLAGSCVPVEIDNGEVVVAILDQDDEYLLCAFGKDHGWYCAYDSEWSVIARSQFIQDVMDVLPGVAANDRRSAANAA